MRLTVDGDQITDRSMLHDLLAEALHFPAYYGRNLDALYDMLSSTSKETVICIRNQEQLGVHLGTYAEGFFEVLRDASLENPALQICFENKDQEV